MTKRRKLSPNYAKYREYYLDYERKHWPEYYRTHASQIKKQRHEHYLANRTSILKRDHEYVVAHRNQKHVYNKQYRTRNLVRLREHDRRYYWENIDKIKQYRKENAVRIAKKRKEYNARIKTEVLSHYSGGFIPSCAVCGETHIVLLTIDHVKENGAEELRELGKKGGIGFYGWLKKNAFPEGYQVLCYNCNWIRRYANTSTVRSRYSGNIKLNVLSHYSEQNGKISCAICGEDRLNVLTIDHIYGGGHKEQQKIGMKGTEYYRYLIKKGYPPGFRVLCMNCNVSSSRQNSVVAMNLVH